MYAVEFLIEQLAEQIKLAPQLTQNDEPGGSLREMLERLQEGVNMAGHVHVLKAVEGGSRRYRKALEAAIAKLEPLQAVWDEINSTTAAKYNDGEQRQRAMGRLKDKAGVIKSCCEAAAVELKAALGVIEEGEAKAVKR